MAKINKTRTALINFLEEVESDREEHPSLQQRNKAKELSKHCHKADEKDEDQGLGSEMDEASFSRQHYEAIAKILRDSTEVQTVFEKLEELFAKDNPNFDRARFIKAVLGGRSDLQDSSVETHYKERG